MDTQIKVSVHIWVDVVIHVAYMEIEYLLECACEWDYNANLVQSKYDHLCFIGNLTSSKSYNLLTEIGIYNSHFKIPVF